MYNLFSTRTALAPKVAKGPQLWIGRAAAVLINLGQAAKLDHDGVLRGVPIVANTMVTYGGIHKLEALWGSPITRIVLCWGSFWGPLVMETSIFLLLFYSIIYLKYTADVLQSLASTSLSQGCVSTFETTQGPLSCHFVASTSSQQTPDLVRARDNNQERTQPNGSS